MATEVVWRLVPTDVYTTLAQTLGWDVAESPEMTCYGTSGRAVKSAQLGLGARNYMPLETALVEAALVAQRQPPPVAQQQRTTPTKETRGGSSCVKGVMNRTSTHLQNVREMAGRIAKFEDKAEMTDRKGLLPKFEVCVTNLDTSLKSLKEFETQDEEVRQIIYTADSSLGVYTGLKGILNSMKSYYHSGGDGSKILIDVEKVDQAELRNIMPVYGGETLQGFRVTRAAKTADPEAVLPFVSPQSLQVNVLYRGEGPAELGELQHRMYTLAVGQLGLQCLTEEYLQTALLPFLRPCCPELSKMNRATSLIAPGWGHRILQVLRPAGSTQRRQQQRRRQQQQQQQEQQQQP